MAVPSGTTTAAAHYSSVVADLYVDFEAGSDGDAMTAALMDAGTHGGAGWYLHGSGHVYVSTSGKRAIAGGVNVDGTVYADGGTRGFKFDPEGAADATYLSLQFPEPFPDNVSFGTYFMSTSTSLTPLSIVCGLASTSDYLVTHWTYSGSQIYLHIKSGDSGSIPIAANTWYWLTGVLRTGGMNELSAHLAADGSLVGTSSIAASGAGKPYQFVLGRSGADAAPGAGQWYWDNIVLSLSGVFPLLPARWN